MSKKKTAVGDPVIKILNKDGSEPSKAEIAEAFKDFKMRGPTLPALLEMWPDEIQWMDGKDGRRKNPRTATDADIQKLAASIEADPEFLKARPALASLENGQTFGYAGHQRAAACRLLGRKIWVWVEQDVPFETQEKRCLIDNDHAGAWDLESLKTDWGGFEGFVFQVPVLNFEPPKNEASDGKNQVNYTRKIEAPNYEPKEEKPSIEQLFDLQKTLELIECIDASKIPEQEKEFLRHAANRHTVFNYAKIAEFYAHSDATTQRLFEDSALVIIDFDQAIEGGFVKLTNDIIEIFKKVESEP